MRGGRDGALGHTSESLAFFVACAPVRRRRRGGHSSAIRAEGSANRSAGAEDGAGVGQQSRLSWDRCQASYGRAGRCGVRLEALGPVSWCSPRPGSVVRSPMTDTMFATGLYGVPGCRTNSRPSPICARRRPPAPSRAQEPAVCAPSQRRPSAPSPGSRPSGPCVLPPAGHRGGYCAGGAGPAGSPDILPATESSSALALLEWRSGSPLGRGSTARRSEPGVAAARERRTVGRHRYAAHWTAGPGGPELTSFVCPTTNLS